MLGVKPDPDKPPLASNAQAGAVAEGSKFNYNPLTDWSHKDTIRLCEHVGRVGAQQWDVLAELLRCPAVLCALKWHVLVLEHERSQARLNIPKWYSEWELCVLMKACSSGLAQNMSKASIYQVMAGWLPGRTAAGLKQAYVANLAPADGSAEPQMTAAFQKNKWPTDLTPLMMAWPGPHQVWKVRTTDQDKAAAAKLLVSLQEKGPATSNTSSGRRHSAAAAAAAAASATPPASPGVTSPPANPFGRHSVQLSGTQQQVLHRTQGHNGMLRMMPAAMTPAALAAPALLLPTEPGTDLPAMQQLQAMGSGSDAGGLSWLQAQAQDTPAPPHGRLLHTVGRLQPPQHALQPQHAAHWQQQQQGQEQASLQDFHYLEELQAAAQFAVTEGTSAAAAAAVESAGHGAAARDEFDLPEEDTLLRQALEQHLDAALCAAAASDLQNANTAPMQGGQQQQQTGVPIYLDTVVDVAAAVTAAAAASENFANCAQMVQGPKRQKCMGGNHLPAASQPPHMLLPGFLPRLEWGQSASQGRANSFPGGSAQGPGRTAQHSTQQYRRSTSGLRSMTASDQGFVGISDANWAQQQQQEQQQQQQTGWVPHGPQTKGQQQPWALGNYQQQYHSHLADQQQRQPSPMACPPPTWEQVNLLLQRVQALEQQQQVMQEEIVRLRTRSGNV